MKRTLLQFACALVMFCLHGLATAEPIVVLDAVGQPIPNASVQIDEAKPMEAGSDGVFTLPPEQRNAPLKRLKISQPDYGVATADHTSIFDGRMQVPLVKNQTPAAERSVRGVVVGLDGQPLAGMPVRSIGWRATDASMSQPRDDFAVVTDQQGRFRCYPPGEWRNAAGGARASMPEVVMCKLVINPAQESGLALSVTFASNGTDLKLEMTRGVGRIRIRFEDVNDKVLDMGAAGIQPRIFVVDKPYKGYGDFSFEADETRRMIKEGAQLPIGWLRAQVSNLNGSGYVEYPAVEVTADTKEIVFRARPAVTYQGVVVDGQSGKPVAGALVAVCENGGGSFVDVTSEEWDAMETKEKLPNLSDPAFKPFLKRIGFSNVSRTDADGRFSVTTGREHEARGVLVAKKDFIAIMAVLRDKSSVDGKPIELETLSLWPAARVIVRIPEASASMYPAWSDLDDPVLAKLHAGTYPRRQSFQCFEWLQPGVHAVYVPADVPMKLWWRLSGDSNRWHVESGTKERITVKAGESLDLGTLTAKENILVAVRVEDMGGRPLAGMPVRVMSGGMPAEYESSIVRTDVAGESKLWIRPEGRVTFGVAGFSSVSFMATSEELEVGTEAPRKPVVIRLTVEQVAAIRKPK